MSDAITSGLDSTKQAAIDFFSDNNPVLKKMNMPMKDAQKWAGIFIILIIIGLVFRTTIIKMYGSIKGFVKRNMPSLNFLLI